MINITEEIISKIFSAVNYDWKRMISLGTGQSSMKDYKSVFAAETNNSKYIINYKVDQVIFDEAINKKTNHKVDILYSLAEKKSKNWIVGIHPYTSNKEKMFHYVNFYRELGFNVLCFDLRNHGTNKSDESYTSFGIDEVDDLETTLEWLTKKFKPKNIGLHGVSMGAYIANRFVLLNKNSKYSIKFVISDSTYFNYHLMIKKVIMKMAKSKIPQVLITHQRYDLITDMYIKYCKDKYNLDLNKISTADAVGSAKNSVATLFIASEFDDYTKIEESHDFMMHRLNLKINDSFVDLENKIHARAFFENTKQYVEEIEDFLRTQSLK